MPETGRGIYMPVVEIVIYDYICSQCEKTERRFIEANSLDIEYDIPEGWSWRYPSDRMHFFLPKRHLYCNECKNEHSERMPL